MAASSPSLISGRSVPFKLTRELELESSVIVTHFQNFMKTDETFREKIDALLSENYLGFLLFDWVKRPVWITPTKECFPVFSNYVISHSKGGAKIWMCAVDLTKKKLRALAQIQETHPSLPKRYPEAWSEYQLISEQKIGPKCLGYHVTQNSSFYGYEQKITYISYVLQAKYDQDLRQFLQAQFAHHRGDKSKLESIAHFVSAHMIIELAELHDKGIIHRDVKLENFLISRSKKGSYKLKITDLESAEKPGISGNSPGTRIYVSPQYVHEIGTKPKMGPFTVSVYNDAWAAGIGILKMRSYYGLSKKIDFILDPLIDTQTSLTKIYSLFQTPDWISAHEPEDPFEKVMWRLLRVSVSERWTVQQAREYITPFAPPSLSL